MCLKRTHGNNQKQRPLPPYTFAGSRLDIGQRVRIREVHCHCRSSSPSPDLEITIDLHRLSTLHAQVGAGGGVGAMAESCRVSTGSQ